MWRGLCGRALKSLQGPCEGEGPDEFISFGEPSEERIRSTGGFAGLCVSGRDRQDRFGRVGHVGRRAVGRNRNKTKPKEVV